ncbi:MAG: IclR family transcriptional regulator C-terminal domain-containing protein, partial [Umezawaea sp.]
EAKRREIAESMEYPKLTANTITDATAYLAELDRVRERGYAVDNSEHEDFIHCIGAPIRGSRGEVVAAVSMSVPKVMLDLEGLLALVPNLLATARAASTECGYTPRD